MRTDKMGSKDGGDLRGLSLEDLRRASTSSDHPLEVARRRSPAVTRQQSSPAPASPTEGANNPNPSTSSLSEQRAKLVPKSRRQTTQISSHTGDSKLCVSSSSNMAREQEPPRGPLGPSSGNAALPPTQSQRDKAQGISYPTLGAPTAPVQPQFGRPSELGASPQPPRQSTNAPVPRAPTNPADDKYSHLFINKGNRPEPQRPHSSQNLFHNLKEKIEKKVHDYAEDKLEEYFQPKKPATNPPALYVAPVSKPRYGNNDFFASTASSQYPASRPTQTSSSTFSSNSNTNPYYRPVNNVGSMVSNIGFATNHNMFHQDMNAASDPFTYMDSAKANDDIKALLAGAMEDEEDKPRTRRKKKAQDAKVDDLNKKMQGMKVEDQNEGDDEEEEEDDGTVEGLKVKLLPHQIDGVAWMRDKELGTKKTKGVYPKGGILADDMGLGKTIQSIALMLTNPKPTAEELENNKRKGLTPGLDKGTLVVAPLALIKQWEGEIKDRVESSHAMKVCVHHGPKRAKSFKELRKFDVVITTYQTLSSEHADSQGELKIGCFGVKWYRVILDEAHSIKNRNAKATKAACALNAEYRWCLTGTPMQNNLDELQSLIHFLRIKPYDDLNVWRDQITQPMNGGRGGLAIKRLRAYLQAFMKRRTKDVLKQDGGLKSGKGGADSKKNEFKIVKRTVEKVEADFTPDERAFYARLESRADKSLEMMMAGNKMSYASALVLLMRLRQACNHPRLTGSDLSTEKDSTTGSGSQTPSRKKAAAVEDMDSIADMLGGLSVQTKRCDVCQTELSTKEVSEGAIRCVDCEDDLQKQVLTVKHKEKKQTKSQKKKPSQAKPMRQKRKQACRIIDSDDEEDEDDKEVIDLTSSPNSRESDDEDDLEDSDLYGTSDSDSDPEIDLIASTKIRHLLKLLAKTAPSHKVIVFSFFTSMLDLIEPFLQAELPQIKYVKYYGTMKNDEREASLNSLRNDPRTRVLLCSLRAGSLGLNLTAASRVVILEPFWNPFVEEQAIDRVHRLNQTQDVVVYKFTIKDTVEERILELQEKKRELANQTIEGQGKGGMKLTLQDMLKLFRRDAESEHGVDGIGMRDERGVLQRGDEVRVPGRYEQPAREKRKEHEVYGRRW
jgi:SNF2 family DNA or RNA helicase